MSAAALIALPLALLLPSPAPAQFAVARTVRAAPPRLGLFGRFRQKRAVEAAPQIEVGAEIPNVDVEIVPRTMLDDEPEEDVEVRPIGDALGPGKTILVGMPGAFTPTCTDAHLPGYMNRAAQFAQVGVSNIGVVTTNDRFVNEAWTKALEACTGKPSTLDMYSDGDGDLVKALASSTTWASASGCARSASPSSSRTASSRTSRPTRGWTRCARPRPRRFSGW